MTNFSLDLATLEILLENLIKVRVAIQILGQYHYTRKNH